MNLKQKLSLFSGLLLPSLALSAYFLITPVRAIAGGYCHAPCGYENTGCQSGSGYCWPNGSQNGIYVFCANQNGQPTGPGSCSDGYVTCRYGGWC